MNSLFTNIIGSFVFNKDFKLVDKILFKSFEDYQNKEKSVDSIKKNHKVLKEPDRNTIKKILLSFKNKQFFNDFYNMNIQLARFNVKNSVTDDTRLIQAVNSVDELDKVINILAKPE